jgi:hypothetical protein
MGRAEAEFGLGAGRVGVELRRIAWPARADPHIDRPTRHLPGGVDDLLDAQTSADTEIVRAHGVALPIQNLQSQDVGPGEIAHMNVVADAGAVRGRVVVAIEREGRAVTGRGQQKRYEMRFRIMSLPEFAAQVGA